MKPAKPPLSCRPSDATLEVVNKIGEEKQLTNSYIVSQLLLFGIIAYERGEFKIMPSDEKVHQRQSKEALRSRKARGFNHGVEDALLPEDQTALRNDQL